MCQIRPIWLKFTNLYCYSWRSTLRPHTSFIIIKDCLILYFLKTCWAIEKKIITTERVEQCFAPSMGYCRKHINGYSHAVSPISSSQSDMNVAIFKKVPNMHIIRMLLEQKRRNCGIFTPKIVLHCSILNSWQGRPVLTDSELAGNVTDSMKNFFFKCIHE